MVGRSLKRGWWGDRDAEKLSLLLKILLEKDVGSDG